LKGIKLNNMIIDKAFEIPTMTSKVVHDYLEEIGGQWTGQGVAMELGCFMGASSAPLLKGLVKAGYDKEFWAFDRWVANSQQVEIVREYGIKLKVGDDVFPYYSENIFKIYMPIFDVPGYIPNSLVNYSGAPIEICIIDAPKRNPVFSNTIKALYKYWIPGTTIVGLLDYKWSGGVVRDNIAQFVDANKNSFELIKEWDNECPRFYKYIKPLRNI